MANNFYYDKDNNKWIMVSADNPMPVNITDTTITAEFTPGSSVKLTDGTHTLDIESDGSIPISFTPTGAFHPATEDTLLLGAKDSTLTDGTQKTEITDFPSLSSGTDSITAVTTGLNELVGEVQASPTSNTILDRLKTIGSNIAGNLKMGGYKSRYVDLSWTDDILATGTKSVTLSPTTDRTLIPMAIYISIGAVPSSGTGNHYFEIYGSGGSTSMGLFLRGVYNGAILYQYNEPITTNVYYPNDKRAFIQALQSLVVNSGNTLTIKYTNNTDATQTANATIQVRYIEVPQLD